VGVTGARGVVSAASYERGRSASAPRCRCGRRRRRPGGTFLPVDGAASPRQPAGDGDPGPLHPLLGRCHHEAFLDVAGSQALFGSPGEIARRSRAAVRDEVGLTASVGVATTKLVAKVASDLRKPDGLVVVPPGEEAAFLAPLPIGRLWGVGAQTQAILAEQGVRTIGQLAALPIDVLVRRLGAHGATLHDRARGIDPSPVVGEVAAKSVSHETTFDVDTADADVIERTLLALSEGVASRLRAGHVRASTIAVKVRDSSFHTVTRQRTLAEPTDLADPIFRAALDLVRPEVRGRRIRLLGVGAHGLGEPAQMGLFATEIRVDVTSWRRRTRSAGSTAAGPSRAPGSSATRWPIPAVGTRCSRSRRGASAAHGRTPMPRPSAVRARTMVPRRRRTLTPRTPERRSNARAKQGGTQHVDDDSQWRRDFLGRCEGDVDPHGRRYANRPWPRRSTATGTQIERPASVARSVAARSASTA
jgi:DNA polymerase-4